MHLYGELVEGIFIKRPNRFEALVYVDGEIEIAHVPNTGRMRELLIEGCRVVLRRSENPKRKTRYSLHFVYKNDHLICINSILANSVFSDAVSSGRIDWVSGDIKREVSFRSSRIDFFIDGPEKTFVEVKCGTYEEDGIVMFPDAPTERGRRHVDEMVEALKDDYRSAIVIIAFMDYVNKFTPNYKIDREFGEKLKWAYDSGVIVKSYNCSIELDEISIKDEIEVYF